MTSDSSRGEAGDTTPCCSPAPSHSQAARTACLLIRRFVKNASVRRSAMSSDSTRAPAPRFLDRADVAGLVLLMAIGLTLRLSHWSGMGLGDDRILRYDIATVLEGRLPF